VSDLLQHLFNGVTTGCILALIALGYTMVYGVLKLINFAHSDVFMVGAFMGYYAAHGLGLGGGTDRFEPLKVALVFIFAMAICGLLGFFNEKIAYRPLRGSNRITSLITAIGVSFFLEYGGQMVFSANYRSFPEILPKKHLSFLGIEATNYPVIILVTAISLMAALSYIVYFTRFGRAMRAVSYSFETASLMGIPTDRVVSTTFVIGSTLAAAGGVLYALNYGEINPLMGVMPGLKSFVAAVLGGIGIVPGAMLGGLLIGLCDEFVVVFGLPTSYQSAITFTILILVLLFRPAGLLGKHEPEKV
jgi:branched-chain amino acid transport system permease protein